MINYNAFNNDLLYKLVKLVEFNKKSSLIIEEENKVDAKYKTELCKKFQSTGKCPYGYKCRFAHGKEELISKLQGLNYKKKPCKTFNEKGYCPYGSRCSFKHDERTFSETSFSYFYLQLFLFKTYNFLPSRKNFYSERSILLYRRLPIFESLSQKNIFNESDKNFGEIDTNNSLIILSNNSDEEIVHKKVDSYSNDKNNENDNENDNDNDIDNDNNNNENIIEFFRKYGIDSIVEEKLNNNDKSNNEINKENICENIKC
jgi:hypothetical protein